MDFLYDGINIYYQMFGEKKPIILLHGWGTNSNTFYDLINYIKNDYLVYAIDLPGFGKSNEPKKPYSLNDYVDFLEEFIKALQIEKPVILGHSFGGRIAIKYASKSSNIGKLILVDSAGIKPHLTLNKRFKILRYKFLKFYYKALKDATRFNQLTKEAGSIDYKSSSEVMKGTLVRVVNEDLKKHIKKIKCETLLIWGSDDASTPLKDAKYMNKHISNSGLVVFDDCGHFPYIEKKYYFHLVIGKYLEVKK